MYCKTYYTVNMIILSLASDSADELKFTGASHSSRHFSDYFRILEYLYGSLPVLTQRELKRGGATAGYCVQVTRPLPDPDPFSTPFFTLGRFF